MPPNWRHPGAIVQEVIVSVPESRSFSFPKSRSKYLSDAVKIAKTLPGFEKSKKHYKVTFGKGDTAPEGLWELLKIAGHWKGSVYLIDGKTVDQEAWEKAFRDEVAEEPAVEAEVVEELTVEKKEPEAVEEAPTEPDPPEPTPDPSPAETAATEAPAPAEVPVEAAAEVEVSTEDVPEEETPAEEAESKEPESKPDPVPEKKSPPKIEINPAPKPEDNSGCGKSAAVFMIAALGLLQLFR